MVKYKLIGRDTYQVGKTLWEIVGNLKDYGVGRLITKGVFSCYPEPSFFKVVKVEAFPEIEKKLGSYRKCIVVVETVFRGLRLPELKEIHRVSYKPDYRLIPKDEEHLWYEKVASIPKFLPNLPSTHVEVPPVLKLILNEERKSKGQPIVENMITEGKFKESVWKQTSIKYRKDVPKIRVLKKYGTPAAPSVYNNIEEYRINFLNENKSE